MTTNNNVLTKLQDDLNYYKYLLNKIDDLENKDKKVECVKVIRNIKNLIELYKDKTILKLGDYISVPIYSNFTVLAKVVKVDGRYHLLDVDNFEDLGKSFNSLEELSQAVKEDSLITCWNVDIENPNISNPTTDSVYKYLIHDKDYEVTIEVKIIYDKSIEKVRILSSELEFEPVDTFEDAVNVLKTTFYLVAKLY